MDAELQEHNKRVRKWADMQPTKTHARVARAFGYPANKVTHSHRYSFKALATMSKGKVSVTTLTRYLPDFEASGAIVVERRWIGRRKMPSIYHIHLDRVAVDLSAVRRAKRKMKAEPWFPEEWELEDEPVEVEPESTEGDSPWGNLDWDHTKVQVDQGKLGNREVAYGYGWDHINSRGDLRKLGNHAEDR